MNPRDAALDFLTPGLRADLLERWSDPRRAYHGPAHLDRVLRALDLLAERGEPFDPTSVRLAAWFHAAEFDPTGSESTERSAQLAERLLDPAAPVAEVARLVRVLAGHRVEPGDPDAAVLSDADLSVLGSGEDAYDEYVAQVRREYAHVPEERFRAARRAVLDSLLGRRAIFHTTAGRDEWERRARANLHRELAGAVEPPGPA